MTAQQEALLTEAEIDRLLEIAIRPPWGIGSRREDAIAFARAALDVAYGRMLDRMEDAIGSAVLSRQAGVQPGWQMVPKEPQPGMVERGKFGLWQSSEGDIDATAVEVIACWRYMLEAAPPPHEAGKDQE